MTKAYLLFPPGWTLATGSPHIALPLLGGFLRANGVECFERDVNIEAACRYVSPLQREMARESCRNNELEAMNVPYFNAEDELMRVAARFGGTWNAQLGFQFDDSPHLSLRSAIEACTRPSPFTSLFSSEVVPDIIESGPQLVGLSIAAVGQLVPALELSRLLRLAGFRGFIVLGGNTISRLAAELAKPELFRLVDGLVTFQGELTLLALCKVLAEGSSIRTVPGLIWNSEGRIQRNENTTNPTLMANQVATPDYRHLPLKDYWGTQYLNLVAARGCYYGQCSFCAIPYGWGNGGFAGIRSIDNILADIEHLIERHGTRRFKFVDEALSPAFMASLSRRLLDAGLEIQWEGYVRLESSWLSTDFVDLLAKAGFRKGYFGLELISPQKRHLLNKKDNEDAIDIASLCSDYGVKVHFFCMFGFPGTGKEDAEATVEALLANKESLDTVDIFPWTYTKHTKVAGVQRLEEPGKDLTLEFAHKGLDGNLSSEAVLDLAQGYEELIWRKQPQWLHPTYRLVSPWR